MPERDAVRRHREVLLDPLERAGAGVDHRAAERLRPYRRAEHGRATATDRLARPEPTAASTTLRGWAAADSPLLTSASPSTTVMVTVYLRAGSSTQPSAAPKLRQ